MKFVKICLLFFIVACTCAESLKELNKKMVCAVNKEREKYGLPYLALSDNLIQAAQRHSEYQYKNKSVTHDENIKGYEKSWDRIKQSGFKNQAYTGENVAGGYKTIEEVMKGWMKSKGKLYIKIKKNK